jgi:spermidine/putrescine transport system substrate-binding protein
MHHTQVPGSDLSRREFLRRAGLAGVAVPTLGAILAACGGGADTSVETSAPTGGATGGPNPYGTGGVAGAPYPLPRSDAPVTWAIQPDNPPIESDLPPEKNATLKIYNWPYYLSPPIKNRFEQEHNCKVEVSTFPEFDPGFRKVTAEQGDFDLYFGVYTDYLGRLISGRFLQPLNHDYLPNFAPNVWDRYLSPFYDQESRYTVPYGVYSTGIVWRNDLFDVDIQHMDNPYDVFWTDAPDNKTNLLTGPRDPLAMAMMRKGMTDINTGDQTIINQAHDDVLEIVDAVNPGFDHVDYSQLPAGQAWLHQTWSGNVGSTVFYFLTPDIPAEAYSYWWPPMTDPSIPGAIGNDTLAVFSTGKNPVLAHMFLNMLYDPEIALTNFQYTGYQPPIKSIVPDKLVSDGIIPKNLETMVISEEDFAKGIALFDVGPAVEAQWQDAYQRLLAGV